jgi:hypothetical protein
MPRAIFLEKMRSELEKLGPQHPFDAFGLSDCMSRARFFSLTQMKRFFLKAPSF